MRADRSSQRRTSALALAAVAVLAGGGAHGVTRWYYQLRQPAEAPPSPTPPAPRSEAMFLVNGNTLSLQQIPDPAQTQVGRKLDEAAMAALDLVSAFTVESRLGYPGAFLLDRERALKELQVPLDAPAEAIQRAFDRRSLAQIATAEVALVKRLRPLPYFELDTELKRQWPVIRAARKPDDAVEVTEISDYACPSCETLRRYVADVLDGTQSQVSYRHIAVPLGNDEGSQLFSSTAYCLRAAGAEPLARWTVEAFRAFKVPKDKGATPANARRLLEAALERAHLGLRPLLPCIENPQTQKSILQLRQTLVSKGLFQLPLFIVDGQAIPLGARPLHIAIGEVVAARRAGLATVK